MSLENYNGRFAGLIMKINTEIKNLIGLMKYLVNYEHERWNSPVEAVKILAS